MKFEGIRNLRDLGGITGADGRKVKAGLLYRSASLFGATASDMERLFGELGIRQVIDLRTNLEKEEKPDPHIEGIHNLHIPVFHESAIGITHETGANFSAFIRHSRDRKAILDFVPDMTRIYVKAVLDPGVVARMGETIRCIIDNILNDRPTLFHCSEGKDRAGAIAAFTLCLLGVSEQDVLLDYAATNKAVKPKAMLDTFLVTVFKLHPRAALKVWKASIADPAYLKNSFDAIRARYGSLETYLRDAIGITDALRDRFRAKVLAGASER